ncbi:MAG: UDP-N-acetylmuramoyl-L-alanyl-D-glutamate--2,6-diaminopimelate ligase [Halioglobus sp.]
MHTDHTAMNLAALLELDRPEFDGVEITGIELDSRKVSPGDLFLAVRGEVHDGRQFIEQAVADGAAAIVAEAPVAGFVDEMTVPVIEVPELQFEVGSIASRFYAHPSQAIHVVGITGTNGKTTTSHLMAQLGRIVGKSCGVVGTLGSNLDGSVSQATNTTPDPVSIQRQLAVWRDKKVFAVGMEVSSHALLQGRVCGVAFETAVFTNLTQDHLDYHGSMTAYGQAKQRLFAMPDLKHALVNLDDEYAATMIASIPAGVRVLTYSVAGDNAADILFHDLRFHAQGVEASLRTPWGEASCSSPLRGVFNLANLAAAIGALLLAGEDLDSLCAATTKLTSVSGRMQSIPNTSGIQAVVDYAHTPDALEQVLRALRPHIEGRLITVFGCGGDRDRSKRSIMGRVACTHSDQVVVTSDNPRSENPLAILCDIEAGCSGEFVLVSDRGEAIALAVAQAAAGDCVLVAGKGHEDYQIVDDQRLYFSDEQQVTVALERRAGS